MRCWQTEHVHRVDVHVSRDDVHDVSLVRTICNGELEAKRVVLFGHVFSIDDKHVVPAIAQHRVIIAKKTRT